jgi:two-component system, NtrC family, response regulator
MGFYSPIRILVVDDEESIRRLIQKEIGSQERTVQTAGTAREASELAQAHSFDVIVLDIRLPDGDGLDLMTQFREAIPDIEVVLITGHGDVDNAVEAMKIGAYDYITKPFALERLELVIEKAYQRVCLQRENRLLRHTQNYQPHQRLVGRSEAVGHIKYLIDRVAPTHVPVLLIGESGTGKDVVAHAIHTHSERANQPFIIKNCGTLQRELSRSELFGHTRGAFTGADESREGLLSLADQGTLFLDEIGELPLEVQASLLRVLENRTYRRVGDKVERQVDVRFIFATNRNLPEEVENGRFHEALYHRINVFQIRLPALRDRREDIPLLVEYFIARFSPGRPSCQVPKNVMQCLMDYQWPGNIRELRNVIERGIILSENGMIGINSLPRELTENAETTAQDGSFLTLEDMEKRHIRKILDHSEGNRTQAAQILGISRKTLYRKVKEYHLD